MIRNFEDADRFTHTQRCLISCMHGGSIIEQLKCLVYPRVIDSAPMCDVFRVPNAVLSVLVTEKSQQSIYIYMIHIYIYIYFCPTSDSHFFF